MKPTIDTAAIDGQLAIIVSPRAVFQSGILPQVFPQAGSDTAATTLAHLWYFLLSNPRCFEQLRKEVDQTFPQGEDSMADLTRQGAMPYLNACM